jgi:hypothetical protein
MTKQIYDKHKAIWWEHVNAGQSMTRDNFIRLQDIAYLDQKHKKGNWRLHTNPSISIQSWALQFLNIFHKILDYYKCILCCTNPIHSWKILLHMCPF